jgi:enoyl-CoA hydratase/carnithine racemase
VGLDRARRLITQGDTLDATSALEAGLVTALSAPTAPTTAAPEGFSAEAAHCLSLLGPAPAIDRDTLGQIRLATLRALETSGQAESDADLAALVRSAARPGLQSRIRAYRDRVQASRTRT